MLSELSGDALAALREYYSEREAKETNFEDLKGSLELKAIKGELTMNMFSEDWNTSQFWYSDHTATILASQLLEGATAETHIAVVCAPSAFVQLKNMTAADKNSPKITLLEYDERFNVFEEFVHFDFNNPLRLPVAMKAQFDRVLCDPPFLSPDCQTKAAMTVRWLLRSKPSVLDTPTGQIIVCTGATMEDLIHKLYADIHTTSFKPDHAQDRLSNDFCCYANFEGSAWSWR